MQKLFRSLAVAILLVPGLSQPSDAGELKITMSDGLVTLVAHDVTVRQILEEWARVGGARIVNGDKIMGPPVTLELHEQPEAKVLETVLRGVAGYVVAPRMAGGAGSVYDRIMILPTSRPPAVTAAPPTFNRPVMPQPVIPTVEDDQTVVDDQGVPVPAPGTVPPPGAQPFPGPAQTPGVQQPTTTPRPGMPPPPPVPGNPYQTPGARPPGGGVPGATPGPPGMPGAPGTPGGPPIGPGGGPGGGPSIR